MVLWCHFPSFKFDEAFETESSSRETSIPVGHEFSKAVGASARSRSVTCTLSAAPISSRGRRRESVFREPNRTIPGNWRRIRENVKVSSSASFVKDAYAALYYFRPRGVGVRTERFPSHRYRSTGRSSRDLAHIRISRYYLFPRPRFRIQGRVSLSRESRAVLIDVRHRLKSQRFRYEYVTEATVPAAEEKLCAIFEPAVGEIMCFGEAREQEERGRIRVKALAKHHVRSRRDFKRERMSNGLCTNARLAQKLVSVARRLIKILRVNYGRNRERGDRITQTSRQVYF